MFIIPVLNVLPNACVSTFAPIVLAGLGYTPKQVLIMSIPSGVTNFTVVIIMGFVQEVRALPLVFNFGDSQLTSHHILCFEN